MAKPIIDQAAVAFRRGELNFAADIIERCERDLGRSLPAGERRDLLSDNSDWPRAKIVAAVDWLGAP